MGQWIQQPRCGLVYRGSLVRFPGEVEFFFSFLHVHISYGILRTSYTRDTRADFPGVVRPVERETHYLFTSSAEVKIEFNNTNNPSV